MKMQRVLTSLVFFSFSLAFISCGPKDDDVQSAVQAVVSGSACVGVSSKVEDGTVTLSGDCKDQQGITALQTQLKEVYGVKKIVNNVKVADPEITVADPGTLTIANSDTLTAGVRKIVKDYPSVQATVSDSIVSLAGEVKKAESEKLINQLKALKPKSVDSKKLLIK